MTTVVLPPPPTTATAAVSSPSTSTNSCGGEEPGTLDEVESEPDEKENEPRGSNSVTETIAKGAVLGATASAVTEPRYKKRPRVSFESADIVEFEPTLYTTTVTSGGIPVGMSFTERSRSRRRLDSWELERTDARVGRQSYMEEGYLDPTERESILNKTGYDGTTMVVVEAEVNRIIADRRESNEVDFEFMFGLGEAGNSLVEGDEEDEEDEEEDEDESRQQPDSEHEQRQRAEEASGEGEGGAENEGDVEAAGASRSSSSERGFSSEDDGEDECVRA
ncbi:hypothetical protein PybrP1_007553 [[Pythium] brassicae (nom. inval.)]|nr:hypothetical protein PybrP1_007553 [[Pythium] brassicae (nom. inval.)]